MRRWSVMAEQLRPHGLWEAQPRAARERADQCLTIPRRVFEPASTENVLQARTVSSSAGHSAMIAHPRSPHMSLRSLRLAFLLPVFASPYACSSPPSALSGNWNGSVVPVATPSAGSPATAAPARDVPVQVTETNAGNGGTGSDQTTQVGAAGSAPEPPGISAAGGAGGITSAGASAAGSGGRAESARTPAAGSGGQTAMQTPGNGEEEDDEEDDD